MMFLQGGSILVFKALRGYLHMKLFKMTFSMLALVGIAACAPKGQSPFDNEGESEAQAIIGGSEIGDNHQALKHIVAIYDAKEGFLCTGSLIGSNLVLTAAHCIPNDISQMWVIFGPRVEKDAPKVRVTGALAFPGYRPRSKNLTGDIAVVSFGGATPEYFAALPIFPQNQLHVIRQGTKVMMLGYGVNDGLSKEGAGTMRFTSARVKDPLFSPTQIMLDESQGKSTCVGDSGGPIIIMIGTQAHILGITSYGDETCSQVGVYTSAGAYTAWIAEASQKLMKQERGGRNNPFNGL